MKLGSADVYEVPTGGRPIATAGAGLESFTMFITSLVADLLAARLGNGRPDAPALERPGGVELHMYCCSRREHDRMEPECGCCCDDC
jgi:hypothetical protein